jgi:hypothetical protein
MNKILKILALINVILLLCAPSCGDEQEMANREDTALIESRENIREEFETDYLTESSLSAYEVAAKQKLSDFVDYLRIITDTAIDVAFRQQAAEMIRGIFISDGVLVQKITDENIKELKVSQLITDGLENKLAIPLFSMDSIRIQEPLHRTGSVAYSGTIRFSQNITYPSMPEEIQGSINRFAEIYLTKESKIFGSDTLHVWSVRLGDIR